MWLSCGPPGQVIGRAAIKSFAVEKKGTPGMEVTVWNTSWASKPQIPPLLRLLAVFTKTISRQSRVDVKQGFGWGHTWTFDNTRPLVAAMAVGLAQATLERTRELFIEAQIKPDYTQSIYSQSAAAAELPEDGIRLGSCVC